MYAGICSEDPTVLMTLKYMYMGIEPCHQFDSPTVVLETTVIAIVAYNAAHRKYHILINHDSHQTIVITDHTNRVILNYI